MRELKNPIDMLSCKQAKSILDDAPSNASYLRLDKHFFISCYVTIAAWFDDDDERCFKSPSGMVYECISPLDNVDNSFWCALFKEDLIARSRGA